MQRRKGDDGGCFISALEAVRKWGGVLEHPAASSAWKAFGLKEPRGQEDGLRRTFAVGGLAVSIKVTTGIAHKKQPGSMRVKFNYLRFNGGRSAEGFDWSKVFIQRKSDEEKSGPGYAKFYQSVSEWRLQLFSVICCSRLRVP
jgi:hypothetical protein